MKKLLFATIVLLFSLSAKSQWIKDDTYGKESNGGLFKRVLMIPTGCGGPSSLNSADAAKKQSAIYVDTCNGRIYLYNPHLLGWDTVATGGGGGAVDSSLYVTVTRLVDSLNKKMNKSDSTAGGYYPYSTNPKGYFNASDTGVTVSTKANVTKEKDILNASKANKSTTLTINGVTQDLSANRTWTVATGGTDNTNTGSYYRILVPSSQALKTLAPGFGADIDSTTFPGALLLKVDSATLFTYMKGFIHDSLTGNTLSIRYNFGVGDTLAGFSGSDLVFKDLIIGPGFVKTITDTSIYLRYDTSQMATVAYALYLHNLLDAAKLNKADTNHLSDRIDLKQDKPVQYGTFFTTTKPTTFPPDLFAPSAFYSMYDSAINFSGGAGYWNNYIKTDSSSAATKFTVIAEFTLLVKPTSSSEGIWIGRLSDNTTNRQDIVARAVYTDATHWTLKLFSVYGFTTVTELAAVPYTQTIGMNVGDKYRLELFYNSPYSTVNFSRIDTTKAKYKDVLETISVYFKYPTIITDVRMPNTGGYAMGALGTTNIYRVTKFEAELNTRKNIDVIVIGNSISNFYNTFNPDNSYVHRLFEHTNLSYEVLAGQGDKSSDVLLRRNEYLNTTASYALIELGWNDYTNSVPAATFETNLTTIINDLKSAGVTPIILKMPVGISYDASYYAVAAATGVQLIDVGYELVGFLDAVNIHPNDYGHERVANIIRTKASGIFGYTHGAQYNNAAQVLSKNITANANWDNVSGIYNVDATSGNVQLSIAATDASMIGQKIEVIKTDGTSNSVTVYCYGGATINGNSGFTITGKNQKITLTCNTLSTWIATVSGSRTFIYKNEAATNSNLIVVPGTLYNLANGTLSTNRNIDVSGMTTEGDIVKILNNETGFTWSFSGATVYMMDGVTTITNLTANAFYELVLIGGKIRTVN